MGGEVFSIVRKVIKKMSRSTFEMSRPLFQKLSRALFQCHGHQSAKSVTGTSRALFYLEKCHGHFWLSRALFPKMSRAAQKMSRGKKNTGNTNLLNKLPCVTDAIPYYQCISSRNPTPVFNTYRSQKNRAMGTGEGPPESTR